MEVVLEAQCKEICDTHAAWHTDHKRPTTPGIVLVLVSWSKIKVKANVKAKVKGYVRSSLSRTCTAAAEA